MTPNHQRLREALGAYVAGALDPAGRREVERHLDDCRACTVELARLSPLPGLLNRVSEQEARADLLVPPPDLLDGVIRHLTALERRQRTQLRRWRAVAVAACAAALVTAVVALAPWRSPPDRIVVASRPVPAATSASGQVAAIAWEWGTTVEVKADDLPRRERYELWAVAGDGRRERAGTWGTTASGDATVRGASSIARGALARIEVTDPRGEVLMRFEFPQS